MGELKSSLTARHFGSTDASLFIVIPLRQGLALRQRRCMQNDRRQTVTLVLGGVRSGKSRYAQQLGERMERVGFVATAQAGDDEMQRKIERHQSSRPPHW